MLETPHKSTPKRKRGEDQTLSPIRFSFELSPGLAPVTAPSPPDDGNDSPRSKVAHKFLGLALEGEGGGGASSASSDDEALRNWKRQRADETMSDAPLPPPPPLVLRPAANTTATAVTGDPVKEETNIAEAGHSSPPLSPTPQVPLQPQPEITVTKTTALKADPRPGSGLHKAFPSINRLSDSKSRVKKRTGSPPLRAKRPPRRGPFEDPEDDIEIVDPVRAALTWHEDEITIYDPADKDDDGTGINGIGFKPTPALAAARTMRRRQQMAEYRKREENEARAKRSQRRRGAELAVATESTSPTRKVRFMEGEAQSVVFTTV